MQKKASSRLKRLTKHKEVPKLPPLYGLEKENIPDDLRPSGLSQVSSHPPGSFPSSKYHRRTSTLQDIEGHRSIAKSNYIRNIITEASCNMQKSRVASINDLCVRMAGFDVQEQMVSEETKKEEYEYRSIEKSIPLLRQKKINNIEKIQRLRADRDTIRDTNNELEETLKLYQTYKDFCQSILKDSVATADMKEPSSGEIIQAIDGLEENCITECSLQKAILDCLTKEKRSLKTSKLHLEPVKASLSHRLSEMQEQYIQASREVRVLKEMSLFKNGNGHKRGPLVVLAQAMSKHVSNSNFNQLTDHNRLMKELKKTETKVERYILERGECKSSDPACYAKAEYESFLKAIHPPKDPELCSIRKYTQVR